MSMKEDFISIGRWGKKTFGELDDIATCYYRAEDEMTEFRYAIDALEENDDPDKVSELFDSAVKEMWDVVITLTVGLYQLGRLEDGDKVMAINRLRAWKARGDGTGKHIKTEGFASWTEEQKAVALGYMLNSDPYKIAEYSAKLRGLGIMQELSDALYARGTHRSSPKE